MKRLIVAFLAISGLGALTNARAQSEEELRAQRHQAFRTMISGQPIEAASSLIEVIRALPTDDPSIVDTATGNLQLLIFDVNFLMDDRMRQEFFTKVLDTKESEIDAFIVTLHEASIQKTPQELETFLNRLWEYSRSDNDFISAVALYLLANPYYSDGTDIGAEASKQMAARFPNIEATRNMLSLPIYHRKSRPDIAGEYVRAYTGKPQAPGTVRMRENAGEEKAVAAEDPFITKLEPIMDNMRYPETKREAVDGLLAVINDEATDWRDRYSFMRVLEPEMKAPPGGAGAQGYWKLIEPSMEALANRKELTPDVYRARVLLCDVACAAADYTDALYWAERVLTEQERLYEHPERILYEEAVKTYIEYAESLEQNLLFEEAAKAYERLADYYPNSALAAECRGRADRVRQRVK